MNVSGFRVVAPALSMTHGEEVQGAGRWRWPLALGIGDFFTAGDRVFHNARLDAIRQRILKKKPET